MARKFRQILSRLWAIIGVVLLGLVLMEGIARVLAPKPPEPDTLIFQSAEGQPPAEEIQRQYFEDFVGSMGGLSWQPYVYWGLQPFASQWVNVDADGFRKTWSPPATEHDALKIWMFGGSTLWGVGARDDFTIPSLLAKELNREGFNVQVRNFAVVGYVSTQELLTLGAELRRGETPDIVLFYDGANDILSALFNQQAGLPLLEPLQAEPFWSKIRRSGIYRLLRHSVWRWSGEAPFEATLSAAEQQKLAQAVTEIYRGNVAVAQSLADSRGFDTLFFWQPLVFYKEKQTPFETLSEKRDSFVPIGGFDCYMPGSLLEDFYRQAYDAVANAMPADGSFVDIRDAGCEGTKQAFIDFCHTTEAANEVIALRIAAEVKPRLEKQRGEERRP